jgi:hypothetical protein
LFSVKQNVVETSAENQAKALYHNPGGQSFGAKVRNLSVTSSNFAELKSLFVNTSLFNKACGNCYTFLQNFARSNFVSQCGAPVAAPVFTLSLRIPNMVPPRRRC